MAQYPASFETLEGVVRLNGQVEFTDPSFEPLGPSGATGTDLTVAPGPLVVGPAPAGSADPILRVLDGASVDQFSVDRFGFAIAKNGLQIGPGDYLYITNVAAPPDGNLAAGSMVLWLDATNGAAKLKIKAKSANGTVVTGTVALA